MSILSVEDLSVIYGQAIDAVSGVSLKVGKGRMSALLGANGAGKSTVLKAISGVLTFEHGRIINGRVMFDGKDVTTLHAYQRARLGLIHVREGRHILPSMTVEENLQVAAFALQGRGKAPGSAEFDRIYDYFPVLGERRRNTAGFLSGGEQQMLAIGRALSASPRLVLIDEASLGLAPKIASFIFDILDRINSETGLSILIVEQNVGLALDHAEYVYVLENGRVGLEGAPSEIGNRDAISERYLGGVRKAEPVTA